METLFRSFGDLSAGPGFERPGTGPHAGHIVECWSGARHQAYYRARNLRLSCSCGAEYERREETFPRNLIWARTRVTEQGDPDLRAEDPLESRSAEPHLEECDDPSGS